MIGIGQSLACISLRISSWQYGLISVKVLTEMFLNDEKCALY